MPRKRAWLTPDSPAPETFRGRCFSVPDDVKLVGAVTGALLPLTMSENWEGDGSMSPEDAALIMSVAFEGFVSGDCGAAECPPLELPVTGGKLWRRSPTTGDWEVLSDDGTEWVAPTGDDVIPVPDARGEATSADKICAAATNAVHVIYQLWQDLLGLWQDEAEPDIAAAAFATQVGLTLGGAYYPPLLAASEIVGASFGVFFETMDLITQDTWTADYIARLVCTFKDNATLTGSVVHFNYGALQWAINGLFWTGDANLLQTTQFSYIYAMLGKEAIDRAGGLTAETGSCATCGQWAREFDFSTGGAGWTANSAGDVGAWQTAGYWQSVSGVNSTLIFRCDMPVASGFTIKRIYVEYWINSTGWGEAKVGAYPATLRDVTQTANTWLIHDSGNTLSWADQQYMSIRFFKGGGGSTARVRKVRVWGTGTQPFASYQGVAYLGA